LTRIERCIGILENVLDLSLQLEGSLAQTAGKGHATEADTACEGRQNTAAVSGYGRFAASRFADQGEYLAFPDRQGQFRNHQLVRWFEEPTQSTSPAVGDTEALQLDKGCVS